MHALSGKNFVEKHNSLKSLSPRDNLVFYDTELWHSEYKDAVHKCAQIAIKDTCTMNPEKSLKVYP